MPTTKTAAARLISDDYATERQGWTREATYDLAGHKVRATVYRDSYDFQSRINVEVWSPASLAWNRIQTLSGTDYKELPSSALKPTEAGAKLRIQTSTQPVVDELIAYARMILT